MQKYKLGSYWKSNAMMPINGGTLKITDHQFIITYLFVPVAKYDIDKTLVSEISFPHKGLRLDDGTKDIDLFFLSGRAAELVYQQFHCI